VLSKNGKQAQFVANKLCVSLLKKSLVENVLFCTVFIGSLGSDRLLKVFKQRLFTLFACNSRSMHYHMRSF